MPLTTSITCGMGGSLTSALDLGTVTFPFTSNANATLATGTGANQADLVFADQRTLAASATEDLDLAGVLISGAGAVLTFAKLKAIYIKAASANTNNVVVSRPASNGVPLFSAAGDALAILPGGAFMWFAPGLAGVTVTAATGDLITLTNSAAGTSVTYDVIIVGTSA